MAKAKTQQDVVDLLLEQHKQIKELFTKVKSARGDKKQEHFEELVRLLAMHESAEEVVVHPVARNIQGQDKIVEARLDEEEEAKVALAELYDMGIDHPKFDTELAALAKAVTQHATHEEKEEFSVLRKNLPADKLQRMAGALRAAEAIAPTKPHPMAGESATANLLAGPPLAVFDRMRDAVSDWQKEHKDD